MKKAVGRLSKIGEPLEGKELPRKPVTREREEDDWLRGLLGRVVTEGGRVHSCEERSQKVAPLRREGEIKVKKRSLVQARPAQGDWTRPDIG